MQPSVGRVAEVGGHSCGSRRRFTRRRTARKHVEPRNGSHHAGAHVSDGGVGCMRGRPRRRTALVQEACDGASSTLGKRSIHNPASLEDRPVAAAHADPEGDSRRGYEVGEFPFRCAPSRRMRALACTSVSSIRARSEGLFGAPIRWRIAAAAAANLTAASSRRWQPAHQDSRSSCRATPR